MKKILSILLAGLFASTAAFGLAACGDGESTGGGTEQGSGTEQGGGTEGGGTEQGGGTEGGGTEGGGTEGGGTQQEPEVADVQAPAYAEGDWDASLDLNTLMKGNYGSISPDLFGLFLEDINYASFALDDNLIVNGSFETLSGSSTTNGKKYGWSESGATISVGNTASEALHTNNPSYATVNAQAGGSISNAGHAKVPVAVSAGTDYSFSMFIKNYAGGVTVSVKDKTDAVYATGTFTVAESAQWTKYVKTIRATDSKETDLRVEISFAEADSAFQIDSVKFETLDATDFGMKNYMYKAIADLSPKFFRFPGGCVIEGTNINEAYDWKNSIGATVSGTTDVVEGFTYDVNDNGETKNVTTYGEQAVRKENLNIWQGADYKTNDYYDHEYGLGFYEYFCLCDALGAKAIPIVNCGYSCQTQGTGTKLAGRHGNEVADYIQDAIDLIEFAKGATSTKWGAIRAEMGHPEPFEMDYIGIGNEQWDDYYTKYYEEFLKSAEFRAALTQYNVQPIYGNGVALTDCENWNGDGIQGRGQKAALAAKENAIISKVSEYGIVDQHYYVNYTDMFTHTKMYDTYVRPDDEAADNYYDVFVGEYAANTATPVTGGSGTFTYKQNDWISALSEAAMMTGFERNGDIVKLAAYAPMFAVADQGQYATQAGRFDDNQWIGANMMYFTNTYVVRTPNYFVQQLFMQNAGTSKIDSELTFPEGSQMPQTTVRRTGGSGSRTYDNLYYITSKNDAGDLIVKIVNAGDSAQKFNVNTKITGVELTGIAKVTELYNLDEDKDATSTCVGGDAIIPSTWRIGFTGTSFGIEVKPYSVIAIQIRTK